MVKVSLNFSWFFFSNLSYLICISCLRISQRAFSNIHKLPPAPCPDSIFPSSASLFPLYNLVFSFTFSNFTSASCCPYMSRDVWISTAVWSYYQREDFFRKITLPVLEATTTVLNTPRIIVSRQETRTHQFPSNFKVKNTYIKVWHRVG